MHATFAAVMVRVGAHFPLGELDQAIENAELEFEFHAVYQPLVCCLDIVEARVLEAEDGDVQDNDEDVDVDEMCHDAAGCLASNIAFGPQDLESLINI